jgi:photosystem II stability/assembly factor-like uncharacterized protein
VAVTLIAENGYHVHQAGNAALKTAVNKHPLSVMGGVHLFNPEFSKFVVITLETTEDSTHAHTAEAPTAYPAIVLALADRLTRHSHYGGAIPYQAWPKHPTSMGAAWEEEGTIGGDQAVLGHGLYVRRVVRLSSGLLLASAEDDATALVVYSSANSGRTWTSIGAVIGTEVNCRGFADVGAGVVLAAADGAVYRSANSGTTFASVVSDGVSSAQVAVDIATGYALATLSDPSKVYFSDDGGATWTHIATLSDYIFTLAHINRGTFIACGELGNIYRTTNYGYSWDDVGYVVEEIEFVAHDGEGRIVAVSNFGSGVGILYSVDSGATWSVGTSITPATCSGLVYAGMGGVNGKFVIVLTVAAAAYAKSYYFKSGETTLSADSLTAIGGS